MELARQKSYGQKAPIHQLAIKKAFDTLSPREKLYAHHLSR